MKKIIKTQAFTELLLTLKNILTTHTIPSLFEIQ